MFGYVNVNKPELKIKDFDTYQSCYCGLCRSLYLSSGIPGQITLTYDMTFLSLLLTALYEEKPVISRRRCPLRPWRRMLRMNSSYTDYAADMNVILACYNLQDDWLDDRNLFSWLQYHLLLRRTRKLEKIYPRQCNAVMNYLTKLHQCESAQTADLDLAAGLTGEMLGEIFVCHEDVWAEDLRRLGFFLGKYIYLMDAWEDMEKDMTSGSYNPWILCRSDLLSFASQDTDPEEFLEKYIKQILTMMMAEATRAFERLPILTYEDILRNILYSGVWSKYGMVLAKKKDQHKEKLHAGSL